MLLSESGGAKIRQNFDLALFAGNAAMPEIHTANNSQPQGLLPLLKQPPGTPEDFGGDNKARCQVAANANFTSSLVVNATPYCKILRRIAR
jgi:hypothetical protein